MIDGEKVSDTVGKVNDEVAVGEDLRFQERWWIVERALWVVFLLVIAAGVSGILGRGGVFSRGYFAAPDGSCTVEYERVAHFGTPLRLILHFNPAGQQQHDFALWMGRESARELGFQRSIPAPANAVLDDDGETLLFPAAEQHGDVVLMMQPATFGRLHLQLAIAGSERADLPIIVLP